MAREDIRNLSYDELVQYIESLGEKSFRANQIFAWIYQKGVHSFAEMKNLSQTLRARLNQDFSFNLLKIEKKQTSKDGTVKFLFDLDDHQKIETVLIPTSKRKTVCVSTQVGCKYGCKFCASGVGGWKRNLTTAEILNQILYIKQFVETQNIASHVQAQHLAPLHISHIVFMGIGEPLDNYDNVLKAVRTLNHPKGLGMAARRITISTCGLIPQIQRLADEGMQFELSVSLHGFDDGSRNTLMPVNRKYSFADLVKACREYAKKTKRQITFEYILIKDVTCHANAAKELGRHFKGLLCKMNLIPYNPVKGFDFKPPTKKEIKSFQEQLHRYGIHATLRMPRGEDIAAACGQLRFETSKPM